MKTKELLLEKFGEDELVRHLTHPTDQYRKLDLEPLKDELLKCDEFSECEGIDFMDFFFLEMDGTTYQAQTIKLGDDTKFVGKVTLYNMFFTPEMFDPNKIHTTVKDGALITPTLYDPMTFLPTKKIVLTWNPEIKQDILNIDTEQEQRQILHNLLDNVLENPEEYELKGDRSVLVRGIFKTKKEGSETPPFFTGKPIDTNGYIGYYMEKNVEGEEMTFTLKQKIIPKELKEKFIQRFTDNGSITTTTEEEIENFIKENSKKD
jgi:hypothetical protein